MRDSDAYTIAGFIPSLQLMHRAAMGVFLAAAWDSPVSILVGSGNNGGDGFALACILQEHHLPCRVFTLSQRLSPDSAFYARKAAALEVPVLPYSSGCLEGAKTVVDCMLGTGFLGPLREPYKTAVREINSTDAFVISVDINSGLNGDTGLGEEAVISDLTVTVGFIKNGLITENAGKHMKKLVCADIGIRLLRDENYIHNSRQWQKLCENRNASPAQSSLTLDGHIHFPAPMWLCTEVIQTY